ncbi:MAG: Dna2/Cas4 domain-containing protein [Candidatus Sulfotelmatobacter sp.]
MSIVLMLASTLVFLGVPLFFLARRARSKTGIPSGEVFYQDLMGQPFQAEVLRSPRWGISGKPDCLIRTPEGVVPVELKKSKKPPARGEVYPNHRIQNLAYCALVEDQMRVHVPYGLVIYAGQQVRRVEYTDASRRWLAQVIEEVRKARTQPGVMRNHRISGRCSGCGVRPHCDQSLI